MAFGKLYLLPVPLAENTAPKVLPAAQTAIINRIKHYVVENEKTARRWLKEMGLQTPQSELDILVFDKRSDKHQLAAYFKALKEGHEVGLMSEAGCPGVADPGAELVAEAHRLGIPVIPLVGPSSILLALMASGFNGQGFAFQGYLPIDKADRSRKLKELESLSERFNQTQIFIETPFRNNQLMDEIMRSCHPNTQICVACDITDENEFIQTKTVALWKKEMPELHKRPAIFLLYKKA
ncbi:MAG: SAM-dependent methyltransferase [Sphingobacteriaceae bacterium]